MRSILGCFILSLFLVHCSQDKKNPGEKPVNEFTSAIQVVNHFHSLYNKENWTELKSICLPDSLDKNGIIKIETQLFNNKYEVGPVLKSRLIRFQKNEINKNDIRKAFIVVLDNDYLKCHAVETFHIVQRNDGRFLITDFKVAFI